MLIFGCFLVSPDDVGYTFPTFYGTCEIRAVAVETAGD